MLIQSTHDPKSRISMPAQYVKVHILQESDENNVYEIQGGYMPTEARDDEFQGWSEEEDFWGEEN